MQFNPDPAVNVLIPPAPFSPKLMIMKVEENYEEAAIYMILRPQYARQGKSFDNWITATSPRWQRIAVQQLTRYLSLETGYRQDCEEYVETWIENETSVYAMTVTIFCRDGKERNALIGIITFHEFNSIPVLYHCYLHPFFRRKGLMIKAWDAVKLKFPQFEVEPPLSPAMARFMSKVDCSHIIPSS